MPHREHLFRRIAWRLQALAEGDLSERARGRAHQIARDADLRTIAPSGFFAAGGLPIETARGDGNRDPDSRLPLPGTLLSRNGRDERFSLRSSQLDSGMRTGTILH